MPRAWSLLATILLISACASTRLVDSQVQSFAPHTIATGTSYRFERLPSQHTQSHAQLETIAQEALSGLGLRHDPTLAQLVVQLSSGQLTRKSAHGSGVDIHYGWMFSRGAVGLHQHGAFADLHAQTLYMRHVGLVIRDASTQTILYETHASNENPWTDDTAVFKALFKAALDGFPKPAEGVRRVDISISR